MVSALVRFHGTRKKNSICTKIITLKLKIFIVIDDERLEKIEDFSSLSSSKCEQTHQESSKINFHHNEQKTVEDIIYRATGMTSKQLASECLQFGETFSSKPWLRQFDIALHSSRNRIRRGRPRTGIPESR